MLDKILSAGTSLIGKVAGDWISNKLIGEPNAEDAFTQSQQASAWAYQKNKEMYQNRYKWTMDDMKEAGLNPVLAASGGFNVGSSPNVQAPQAFKADSPYGSSPSTAFDVSRIDKDIAETKNIRQKVELTFQQTKHEIQKILETRSKTDINITEERKVAQEVFKVEQEFLKIGKEIEKVSAEIRNINKKTELQHSEMLVQDQLIGQVKALKSKLILEAKKLTAQLPELEKRSAVYKGVIGSINGAIKEAFSMFGLNLGVLHGFR